MSKTIEDIGITKDDLWDEVKKAVEFLDSDGFHKWMSKINKVKFNGRLRSSGGRVVHKRGELDNYRVEFNPALPAEEFEDTVRHEVAHIITGASDNDEIFKEYCRENGIRLSLKNMLKTSEDYKYQIACENCGGKRKYKRWSDRLDSIEEHSDLWRCGGCGETDVLYVKYLK